MRTDETTSEHRGVLVHVSAPSEAGDAEQLNMTKTVVIAMSCVVAYLGVMAALTVYCLIHMVRARRLRKHDQLQPDERTLYISHITALSPIYDLTIASGGSSERSTVLICS